MSESSRWGYTHPGQSNSRGLLARYEGSLVPLLMVALVGHGLGWEWGQSGALTSGPGPWEWLGGIGFVGTALLLFGVTTRRWAIQVAVGCLVLALGMGHGMIRWGVSHPPVVAHGGVTTSTVDALSVGQQREVCVTGWVDPQVGRSAKVPITLHRLESIGSTSFIRSKWPVSGRILVSIPKSIQTTMAAPPAIGSLVRWCGNTRIPEEARFPGAFDAYRYYDMKDIDLLGTTTQEWTVLDETPQRLWDPLWRTVTSGRNTLAALFMEAVGPDQGPVLGSVVLGDHAVPVQRNVRQWFIDTGLVHLLAASGMNVGIVAAFLLYCLLRIRLPQGVLARLPQRLQPALEPLSQGLPPWLSYGAAMVGVAVYALLTGLPPSILRAATMLELALLLKIWDRSISALALLVISATVLCVVDPALVMDLGFQFSVLTTLGLIAMVPPLVRKGRIWLPEPVAAALVVPMVAQLWVFPISAYIFQISPLHSVLMNVLAVLLVAPMTIIGFISGFLGLMWAAGGEWLAQLAYWPTQGLMMLAYWGQSDGFAWAKWHMAAPPLVVVLGAYGLLLLLSLRLYYGRASFLIQPVSFSGEDSHHEEETDEDDMPYAIESPAVHEVLQPHLSPLRRLLWHLGRPPVWGVCVLILALVWTGCIWLSRQGTTLSVVPLSPKTVALVLKPEGSPRRVVWLPRQLSYWEGRGLVDYGQYLGVGAWESVVLYGPSGRKSQSDGLRYIQTHSEVDIWVDGDAGGVGDSDEGWAPAFQWNGVGVPARTSSKTPDTSLNAVIHRSHGPQGFEVLWLQQCLEAHHVERPRLTSGQIQSPCGLKLSIQPDQRTVFWSPRLGPLAPGTFYRFRWWGPWSWLETP